MSPEFPYQLSIDGLPGGGGRVSAWRAWYESWLQAICITSRGKGSEKIGIVSPEFREFR